MLAFEVMKTDCPRAGHGRTYDHQAKRLTCAVKECRCTECRRALTEAERKD